RTVPSVLRQVEEWHKQLGQDTNQPSLTWRHSPFKDFQLIEGCEALGNMRRWTITEILTSRALFLEGQAMRHCVATYQERCVRRQVSIWSMQIETQRGQYRVLTIEVDLAKRTIGLVVYGTRMIGQQRNFYLTRDGAQCLGKARTAAKYALFRPLRA